MASVFNLVLFLILLVFVFSLIIRVFRRKGTIGALMKGKVFSSMRGVSEEDKRTLQETQILGGEVSAINNDRKRGRTFQGFLGDVKTRTNFAQEKADAIRAQYQQEVGAVEREEQTFSEFMSYVKKDQRDNSIIITTCKNIIANGRNVRSMVYRQEQALQSLGKNDPNLGRVLQLIDKIESETSIVGQLEQQDRRVILDIFAIIKEWRSLIKTQNGNVKKLRDSLKSGLSVGSLPSISSLFLVIQETREAIANKIAQVKERDDNRRSIGLRSQNLLSQLQRDADDQDRLLEQSRLYFQQMQAEAQARKAA